MKLLRRLLSRWQIVIGLLIILFFSVSALIAPIVSPSTDPEQIEYNRVGRSSDWNPHPPSKEAILGTLPSQIDVFHSIIWGSRNAMSFGLTVAVCAFLFGSFVGAVSGFFGGFVNNLLMRITDSFLTFPVIAGVVFLQQLLAMTVNSMGGFYWTTSSHIGYLVDFMGKTPPAFALFLMKVDPLLIVLVLFTWMPIARLVNTMTLTLRESEFVHAAHTIGCKPFRIITKHLLPNAISPAIVVAARDVGNAVLIQATFTFIGLGSTSPWGVLLSRGRDWVIGPDGNLFAYWWVYLPATLAIILFGVGWNLLGDGLVDEI